MRRGGIARQPAGESGRPVAIISVDIPDERFRRTESRVCGRDTETGKQNQNRSKNFQHRRFSFIYVPPYHTVARELPLMTEAEK